ncbi:hypothetical protein NOR_06985 [Metarhizium rileyi]|uniref:Uncharacterized protein n=1 Tax=Metarhizium rileyi (strain RCEF 4871) TaxID=1649241 RepID=A0A166ZGV8_METRR|nr:hypothetical protein NOR_06985 [Metarhizium rileyi RCEF 4871]
MISDNQTCAEFKSALPKDWPHLALSVHHEEETKFDLPTDEEHVDNICAKKPKHVVLQYTTIDIETVPGSSTETIEAIEYQEKWEKDVEGWFKRSNYEPAGHTTLDSEPVLNCEQGIERVAAYGRLDHRIYAWRMRQELKGIIGSLRCTVRLVTVINTIANANFYILRTSDGQRFPAVAIEYKAPHKLSCDEVVTGLVGEIQPNRDVINQEGEGFEFEARRLTTAVITQLFSYMVGQGTQYGYVCTGETYIFLHIPRDPSCVYYSVCIPSLDVEDDDENRLHRTAVAQVYAFVLQAIRSPLPSQAWHNAADQLDTWAVEYDDVLRSIPATLRKAKRTTPYRAQRWKGFTRSPIRTRSQCLPLEDKRVQSSDDDNEDDESPSPTPNLAGRSLGESRDVSSSETQVQGRVSDTQGNADKRQNIRDRPYCTHECLRGIASGGPLDERCPNIADHGKAHIDRQSFAALLRDQLATDRGDDADCTPLGISGSRGSLFKLCLSLRGYTLVAQGVEAMDARHLRLAPRCGATQRPV